VQQQAGEWHEDARGEASHDREAGLIEGERRGTWVYYRPQRDNIRQLSALLETPSVGAQA
jgi:hypothetical protein